MAASRAREIESALRQTVERFVAVISSNVTANLIEDTPRDTGWAAANWVPNLGSATDSPVGSPQAVSAAGAAQQQGLAKVVGYRLPDGDVFISNNVPYIQKLNDGHSAQAPAGFVQAGIARALSALAVEARKGIGARFGPARGAGGTFRRRR